jgi:hypothetical protein
MKRRIYTSTDAYMIENSLILHHFFKADIALFSAFDSSLNLTYSQQWLNIINEAVSFGLNSVLKSQLKQLTEANKKQLVACKNYYREVKYYSTKAFANEKAIQQSFGTKNYQWASRTPERMIIFMQELHATAEKYKTPLIDVGFTQAGIDQIDALQLSLSQSNVAQENFKKDIPVKKEARIDLLNSCYEHTQLVIAAAQNVFRNNETKKQQYVYKTAIIPLFKGTIEPNTHVVIATTKRSNRKFTISNQGTVSFQVGFSNNEETITSQILVALPDKTIDIMQKQFTPPQGKYLLLYNENNSIAKYEVRG